MKPYFTVTEKFGCKENSYENSPILVIGISLVGLFGRHKHSCVDRCVNFLKGSTSPSEVHW